MRPSAANGHGSPVYRLNAHSLRLNVPNQTWNPERRMRRVGVGLVMHRTFSLNPTRRWLSRDSDGMNTIIRSSHVSRISDSLAQVQQHALYRHRFKTAEFQVDFQLLPTRADVATTTRNEQHAWTQQIDIPLRVKLK